MVIKRVLVCDHEDLTYESLRSSLKEVFPKVKIFFQPIDSVGACMRLLKTFVWDIVVINSSTFKEMENMPSVALKKLLNGLRQKQPKRCSFLVSTGTSYQKQVLENAGFKVYTKGCSLQDIAVVFGRELKKNTVIVPLQKIKTAVLNYYGMDEASFNSQSRKPPLPEVRHVFSWLAKRLSNASDKTVGKMIGGRDRTTVMHSCDVVEGRVSERRKRLVPLKEIALLIEEKVA